MTLNSMPEIDSALIEQLYQESPDWFTDRRRLAFNRFSAIGLPSTRQEDWKYTSIKKLQSTSLGPSIPGNTQTADLANIKPWLLSEDTSFRIVIKNGVLSDDGRSSPDDILDGVKITTLSKLFEQGEDSWLADKFDQLSGLSGIEHPFAYLNTACLRDSVVIHLERGVQLTRPIEVIFISGGEISQQTNHTRLFFIAEAGSNATIIETYAGEDNVDYLTNAVSEFYIEQDAVIDHYKLQVEPHQANHISNMRIHQEQNSNFSNHNICLGGQLVRNDINIVLSGSHIECTLNGLYLGNGKQHVDNHTSIDHASPHCNSYQTYLGVLGDRSTAVFNGRIFVRQDAQKTDAKQSNRNLLLSKNAAVNTKPQLEIWADDVRCTHGATIGQLDDEKKFYLQARGIPINEATRLLTLAFAQEVISKIPYTPFRNILNNQIETWVPQLME
jgi:Fe-S cluster assembly protein SufD